MGGAKHTPGPWTFSRCDQFGDARFYVAQDEGAPYTPEYSDVAALIAETTSGERVRIQEANARLIAAAPDLLEVLSEIVADGMHCDVVPHLHRKALAAIAKAGGNAE